MECTKAERIAAKLDGMVSARVLPGLLPEDVSAAAELLREQEAELTTLREALAAKRHIVNATAEREHYRLKIRGEFVIADPRLYYGEIAVDDRTMFGGIDRDWELHVARQLTRVATADWVRDLEERAYVAVRAAIAMARDSAVCGDIPVPQDCQARAESIAPNPPETPERKVHDQQ